LTYDDICAVIVTRGDQPGIVESIVRDLPYGEVIVYDNAAEARACQCPDPDCTKRDRKVFGRYQGASQTIRPFVYFQDDDVIFKDHAGLVAAANETPDRIVANMYDEWIESCGYYDLAMVGLGSIVPNGLWRPYFERYLKAFPDDDRFDLDADFIFGTLAPWVRVDFGHEILDIASDSTRLWQQEDQFAGKWRSIKRARSLRTVTLAMLVKDEEHTAVNALASAKGMYDNVTIVDTGSTDNTIYAIRDWLLENNVPGQVIERPWVDFGHNRNELLAIARTRGDYILMMDADETLYSRDITNDWHWLELTADAYLLHYDGKLDYAQPRLIASRYPWLFTGTVHAALDHPEGAPDPIAGNLRSPLIVHHGWTRHGDTKVQRDIELLNAEIELGHDVARNTFLLAKAYEGYGDKDEALRYYELRVTAFDDAGSEEHYYSRFRLGVLMIEHSADFPGGCDQLFQAYLDRPQRIESLRALAHFCTAMADATPYPEDDLVIVHRDLYRDRDL
jgi:glycosyltransferase involved in cell wall biosynthesis